MKLTKGNVYEEIDWLRSRAEAAESQLSALKKNASEIGEILSEEGCFCDCECDSAGHSETCELCLGCRIDVILQRILSAPEPK